jgi:hypothetical protein
MRRMAICLVAAMSLATGTAIQALACVDVALVLAVDASDSIDDGEYKFQTGSIAAAFRDRDVLHALDLAGTVAISAVFWGAGTEPTQTLAWVLVEDGRGAEFFSRQIEKNRRVVHGETDIGNGIWSALDLLSSSSLCPGLSIVDISSDGVETLGPKRDHVIPLGQARIRAREMRVTINSLVISDDGGYLAQYYTRHVALGSGAFVMQIATHADYSHAIKRKLVKELSAALQAPE